MTADVGDLSSLLRSLARDTPAYGRSANRDNVAFAVARVMGAPVAERQCISQHDLRVLTIAGPGATEPTLAVDARLQISDVRSAVESLVNHGFLTRTTDSSPRLMPSAAGRTLLRRIARRDPGVVVVAEPAEPPFDRPRVTSAELVRLIDKLPDPRPGR